MKNAKLVIMNVLYKIITRLLSKNIDRVDYKNIYGIKNKFVITLPKVWDCKDGDDK